MAKTTLATREPAAAPTLSIRPPAHADERVAEAATARLLAGGALGRVASATRSPAWEPSAPPLAREVAREPGAPLDPAIRAELGDRLGFDLATIRIHADARADRAASLVHARAFTVGHDVVFAAHEYAPDSAQGRRLLLHELVHVAQQDRSTDDARLLHRQPKPSAPEGTQLKRALDSKDDDAVRDLVDSEEWKKTILEAWQAARLLTYLLSGFTGDDDEWAGLKILDNVEEHARLDLALLALRRDDRWEQLFDDYNGPQYSLLLMHLALGIKTLDVRAMFLDKFIDEWWVDLGEEKAIVLLLEHAPDAELSPLLDKRDRESELRDAIDNTDPRRGFERRVVKKNEINFVAGAKRAEAAIKEVKEASPPAKPRSTEKILDLLADAPKDLAAEVKGYVERLKVELDKPEPDWDTVSALQKQFTIALDTIEARKRAETTFELKYNLHLNYLARTDGEKDPDTRGRFWSVTDLRTLDDLLQKLPPDLLRATTELTTISRGAAHPSAAGQTSGPEIRLYGAGGLTFDTLVHELGHEVAGTDMSTLQSQFNERFKWIELKPDDANVPDKVKDKLATFTPAQMEGIDARVEHTVGPKGAKGAKDAKSALPDGTWFIRKNRYVDGYLAHPTDLCFIRDPHIGYYSATDPHDDFAESFKFYVLDGGKYLRDTCLEKYNFMHTEVFVKFFLQKQGERALMEFDKAKEDLLKALPERLYTNAIVLDQIAQLRVGLRVALTAAVGGMHAAAQAGALKHLPLKGNEASVVAAAFQPRLKRLGDSLAPLATGERAFLAAWEAHPFKIEAGQREALDRLRDVLERRLVNELLPMWTPLAARVIAGDTVDAAALAGVDPIVARFVAAIPRASEQFPDYARVRPNVEGTDFGPDLTEVVPYLEKEKEIVDRILAPLPKPGPKVNRQPVDETETARPRRPDQLVPPGGRPLAPDARALMESRIGRDFGDVRVHDDVAAAASADALQADAYTVGPDIMFAKDKHAPGTDDGRELLGHELAHVAQQGGAAAPPPGAQQDASARLPTVLEEPTTIPGVIPAEPDKDAVTPPPPATPGSEDETIMAAPPIALQRAADAAALDTAALDTAGVVPPDHPSERQAAAVGRQVAGRESGRQPVLQRVGGRSVHRQSAPVAKQRVDIVFFMGHRDTPPNRFYESARAFFKVNVKTDRTVDSDKYRSLAGVFAYLRTLDPATPIGNLYLVSHANEDGTLSFGIDAADEDAHTQYGELKTALAKRPELFTLPFGLIDRQSVVHIKGCNIGRSTEMLNKLDEAFGGRGLVTAPTHKQHYEFQVQGGKITAQESLTHYFLEYPGGDVEKTPAQQLAEFRAKYTDIPAARWATLVPKAGAQRKVIAPLTFEVPNRLDIAEAFAQAKEFGNEELARPEMYIWRKTSKKKMKPGIKAILVAEKTNYVIPRVIEDAKGKPLVPDESDPKYFGKSTFAQTPASPADLHLEPAQMPTTALLARIAEIGAELAAPQPLTDEGRTKEAEFERRVMQEELTRRSIAVDVKVVKTEDWLGADEVYIKASRGGASITTPVHKLNDGQQRVYNVPLITFLPLDAPIRFEVYDEDWPDRDDLIVRMDWRPPFAPLQNSESLDEADYRVLVGFQR